MYILVLIYKNLPRRLKPGLAIDFDILSSTKNVLMCHNKIDVDIKKNTSLIIRMKNDT